MKIVAEKWKSIRGGAMTLEKRERIQEALLAAHREGGTLNGKRALQGARSHGVRARNEDIAAVRAEMIEHGELRALRCGPNTCLTSLPDSDAGSDACDHAAPLLDLGANDDNDAKSSIIYTRSGPPPTDADTVRIDAIRLAAIALRDGAAAVTITRSGAVVARWGEDGAS